jgi:serine/threonine protein kinase
MPVADAWLLFSRLGRALAHRLGFVHGGIAPSRILVRDDGSPVLDFTWLDVGARVSPLDAACLPPEYGRVALLPRSDVYALGMLLRVALLGRAPRPGELHAAGSFAELEAAARAGSRVCAQRWLRRRAPYRRAG